GEGASVQVLTTYKKAIENDMPILGEIDSIAFNSSVPAHLLSPSESAFKQTIDECYNKSSVKKSEVSHLDVFGFTNYFGDLVEKQAIEASFDSETYFGNIKHQFGYFKAANPSVVLTKLILMNKNRKILTNSCYNKESSIVEDTSILKPNLNIIDSKEYKSFYMASNVNGIGGNHGHMLVGAMHEYLNPSKTIEIEKTVSKAQGVKVVNASFKEEKVEYNVKDVHTKYKGAKQMIVALLSGQGAQHAGMMKEMYDENSVIRDMMNKGNDIFMKERGYSLLDMMFNENKDINLTENTQPAVFLSTAAVYKSLQEKGFRPDFYIGHSVGEYSALYCSGMLEFDDAMKLIIKRSDFMKMAAENLPGKIMVVFKNSKVTLSLIRQSEIAGIYIANKNSEKQTAVSGSAEEIDKFCAFLKEKGEMYTNLPLSGAFHTPLFAKAANSLKEYMENVHFKQVDYSRVISNVTGEPYPRDGQAIKDLLVKQITSPVEFIKSVENVYASGKTHYIEIGPNRLLSNLLKYINIVEYKSVPSVDSRKGQMKTFKECCNHLESYNVIFSNNQQKEQASETVVHEVLKKEPVYEINDDFQQFKKNNATLVDDLLYQEYLKYEKKASVEAYEKFNFHVGKINIAGVSVGLPGKGRKVFAADNFDKLLKGTNFIEPLPEEEKEKMADMNVTRLFKQPDGNAKFVEINSTEDVIQLAGQLGYFDINDEYGIKKKYDLSMSLAIAAGIEALKDANIPLVMQYKEASTGNKIPNGFALPEEMQEGTGIIITSLFPNSESFIEEINRYYYNKFYIKPYEEFENIYYHIMASGVVKDVKEQITDWFYRIKERRTKFNAYSFDRNFASKYCPLGAAHLAELIKAKGPNILLSSACASTTQAIGVAEDWIRAGRCDRVIVIGGENATSEKQNQWIGTAFLALGAGTVKKHVEDAAKPFDENRNGTILGAGAVSLIVEREDKIKERGFNGQAEVLGTYIGNSAYHTYNIDVNHLSSEMNKFITSVEKRHGLNKAEYPKELVFMSHETYTPARGGSADAEIKALRTAYPDNYGDIVISNTKGYTGHTLGAAIEDAVLVKVLQKGVTPPIANLTNIPKEFEDLNLNRDFHGNYNYGIHLAAGFGSHYAFVFFKRVEENTVDDNLRFRNWMSKVSNEREPNLTLIDNTLCIEPLTIPAKSNLTEQKPVVKTVKEAPVKVNVGAVQATSPSAGNVTDSIKGIIAEQTGYTKDMLEDDLDLEADLGIDTVKQVEIFGKISSSYSLKVPEDLKLRDLNTILKLTDYIKKSANIKETAPAAEQSKPSAGVTATAKKIIAEQTGYTEDMLEADLDLEADLGIDTVKQVEIFGKISSHYSLKVPEDLKLRDLNTIEKLSEYIQKSAGITESVSSEAPVQSAGNDEILSAAKKIISEQTGYTDDMLEADLDLEADLGIDTVKQVEIFGKISSHFGLKVPEDLKLRDLNTIAKLTEYVSQQTGGGFAEIAPVQTESSQTDSGNNEILETAKKIIEEQTGYTKDMLEDDLDLEADLGIDTVKQVEIFGKISSHFGLKVPEDLKLRDLNTIAKLTEYVENQSVSSPTKNITSAAKIAEPETQVSASSKSDEVIKTAKKIIEEQTGYTEDMLEDDLDLEADLGIDTVKQVEIFGKISSHFKLKVPEDLKLRDLNTISKLSDYIDLQISGEKSSETVSEVKEEVVETAEKSVKRFVPDVKLIEVDSSKPYSFDGKTIILTCDSEGFSDKVKEIIESKGGKVLTLGNDDKYDINYDLTDISDTEERLLKIKANNNDIDGIIHLAPIDYYFGDNEISDAEVNACLKSLFLMIQAFYPTLDKKGSIIASMGFDSVVFPYDRDEYARIFPSFAGISGMLKTVNKELENTHVKMVDFAQHDIEDHIDYITETFVNEIESGDRIVEVGFKENGRYGLKLTTEANKNDESFIKDGDTILVTGGMGGITYEILKRVGKTNKVKFIVLGTSDIDGLDETILANPDRAYVMDRVKENMTGKPLEIKNAVDKIMRTLEAQKNLKALQEICEVDYKSCDVQDFESVNSIVSEYEKFDGVLHAAGVEQSQFIEKKELTSFNLVMDVKVKGLVNLLKAFEGKEYKYFMTFSSVTARFGNEGQIDYTTANDLISKALINEKLKHPMKIYKVFGWTAWQGAGMATKDSVMTVLKERGITFLELEKGIDFFMDELYHEGNEAVYTGYDFDFDKDGILESPFDTDFPFLDNTVEENGSKSVFNRTLSLDRDLFLLDHSMDGTPIFLGSTGIETMAEAASKVMDEESNLVEVNDFAIPYGIKILKGRPKELQIESCLNEDGKTVDCNISSVFKNPKGVVMGDPTKHYEGSYIFSNNGYNEEIIDIPEFNPIEYTGDLRDIIYNPNRLFMDGLFETIKDIPSFDGDLLITKICDTSSKEFFKGVNSPKLKTDAVLIDAMFQTGGLLEFLSTNFTVLPYKIKKLRLLQKAIKGEEYYCLTRKTDEGEETNTYQLDLVDKQGKLYIQVKDFQMVKLQRLAEEHRILDRVKY
ncbi:MAG: SDR family oxidoreductase, partial [Deltaproteobacteria bacterium]|nr:SDR family oxidoreductase [Deltaproteobacteria bacterium]